MRADWKGNFARDRSRGAGEIAQIMWAHNRSESHHTRSLDGRARDS